MRRSNMSVRLLPLIGCSVLLLSSCELRAPVAPAAIARPLVDAVEEVKLLRVWVADALPAGTKLLHYEREDAWDGIMYEEWLLDCPKGFGPLKRAAGGRRALQVESETPYQVLEIRLRSLGVRLTGNRPAAVWTMTWQNEVPNTTVSGTIFPHSGGEVLMIKRITVK